MTVCDDDNDCSEGSDESRDGIHSPLWHWNLPAPHLPPSTEVNRLIDWLVFNANFSSISAISWC
jgi:hypothetical protein